MSWLPHGVELNAFFSKSANGASKPSGCLAQRRCCRCCHRAEHEVELRAFTVIGPHFLGDAAQAWRHFAAVADGTKNDRFLGRAGRRDERQRQHRQAGSEAQGLDRAE